MTAETIMTGRLFDDLDRTEVREKREAEPLFEYYITSTQSDAAAVRNLLQAWFGCLPEQARIAREAPTSSLSV